MQQLVSPYIIQFIAAFHTNKEFILGSQLHFFNKFCKDSELPVTRSSSSIARQVSFYRELFLNRKLLVTGNRS